MDNGMPSLTLEPNAMAAPQAPAAATAPSMPEAVAAPQAFDAFEVKQAPSAPTLTLNPQAEQQQQQQPQQQAQQQDNSVQINEDMLTEEEKAIVNDFASKIDISDSNMVMTYGAAAQQHIASFSESALNSVKTKDLGEIGETLSSLVVQLKTMDEPEKKGIAGWFQKKKHDLEAMKANYSKAEANVDKIVEMLEQHQVTLMKDIALFDQMYDLNLKYYKELTMYIIAGKKRLAEVRATKLQELRIKAEQTGAQEDAQAYNDFANLCDRFEKKLHDLELTRMISIQMGPQTRMLQNNDTLMV